MSTDEIEALKRELNIQKALKHEHIVKLYNAFESKGFLYIILEYVEKGNLFEYMKANRLNEDDIVSIFGQVTSAINYLHKQKILHRDIKPENILMKERNFAKLCDFGFCAPYGNDVVRQTMCGTTEYLPPEIIGREDQNDKVDIWCLGVLLYEMTHSKTPFEGQNIHMLQFQQKKHAINFKSDINAQLRTIIEKCLEFEPERRPTAEEILNFSIFSRQARISDSSNSSNEQKHRVETTEVRRSNDAVQQHVHTPNLYNQPLNTQYVQQVQNIYTPKNAHSHGMPLRVDPSPQRVIYKNDMFRKHRNPDGGTQEHVNEPKVVKYSITRITRDGREITETRSTSQSNGGSSDLLHNHLSNGNNNIRTVRVVAQNASVDKKVDPTNFYKQFTTKYSHSNANMYAPSHNAYAQPSPFVTRNIYQGPSDANNTSPTFYKQSDRNITTAYAPKEYKYSYNKPGPEKAIEQKMSYHVPNNTHVTFYNENGVRRVVNADTVKYGRANNVNTYIYGNVADKNRSRSSNDGLPSSLTTRIVRQK